MLALDALGNQVRRDILVALRQRPLAVHQIAQKFPVSRPAISRHMRVLEDAGLVEVTRDGRESLYSVRVQGFSEVREFIDAFWDVALQRLSNLADEERKKR